jgi:DMSO/TMAO reductase YedYZ molybdopterin-dependent catalytic subunit
MGPGGCFGQTGEEVLPRLDQPPLPPPSDVTDNLQSWEQLNTWLTPSDCFFNVPHYDQSENLDEATWRVSLTGLVVRPQTLTLADLKAITDGLRFESGPNTKGE